MDGIHIGPICTDDRAVKSCLELIIEDQLEPHQILATALQQVLGNRFCEKYPMLAWNVVPFLRNCDVTQPDSLSTRRHLIKIQRHVRGEREGYSY